MSFPSQGRLLKGIKEITFMKVPHKGHGTLEVLKGVRAELIVVL